MKKILIIFAAIVLLAVSFYVNMFIAPKKANDYAINNAIPENQSSTTAEKKVEKPADTEEKLASYASRAFNVEFKYPDSWKPEDKSEAIEGVRTGYSGKSGFFLLKAVNTDETDFLKAAQQSAEKEFAVMGSEIEKAAVAGADAAYIEGKGDASPGIAVLFLRYPFPVRISGSYADKEYSYLAIEADGAHLKAIGASLSFIATSAPKQAFSDEIKIISPKEGSMIKSPLMIDGEAKGSWFFEGVFPVALADENGNIIAKSSAEAIGDWMSTGFVPFNLSIKFETPKTKYGYLIFKNDNPSGLKENEKEVRVKVSF